MLYIFKKLSKINVKVKVMGKWSLLGMEAEQLVVET